MCEVQTQIEGELTPQLRLAITALERENAAMRRSHVAIIILQKYGDFFNGHLYLVCKNAPAWDRFSLNLEFDVNRIITGAKHLQSLGYAVPELRLLDE